MYMKLGYAESLSFVCLISSHSYWFLFLLFFFLDAPEITYISAPATLNGVETLTLNCTADGNPEPTITWTRLPNGIILNMPWTVTGKAHAGGYRCSASNIIGTVTKDTSITVNRMYHVIGWYLLAYPEALCQINRENKLFFFLNNFSDIPKNAKTEWFSPQLFPNSQDFTVATKLRNAFKSLHGFEGRCQEIREICMDFEPCLKVLSLTSVQHKIIKVCQIILHKLRSKYIRKHKVESRLLCYEPLFNSSRIKENKTVPPLGKKKSQHDVTPQLRSHICRWHPSLSSFSLVLRTTTGKWFLLPAFFHAFWPFHGYSRLFSSRFRF